MSKNKTDRTWGIDRDPESSTFNELVVGGDKLMPIILWRVPGQIADPENVTGGLKHNQRVEILGRAIVNETKFVKVRKTVIHEGKKYPQTGWLSASLLKYEGK